jgi:hypothetical protein
MLGVVARHSFFIPILALTDTIQFDKYMISPNISKEDLLRFKALLILLKGYAADGISEATEKYIIDLLDNAIPFFSNLILEGEFPEIHRLTINKRVLGGANKRIWNIKYLKYPPKEFVKSYGRCNLKNQSILYACHDIFTTMNEVRPRRGDLVTESTWRLKQGQSIKYSPIFKNQPSEKDVRNARSMGINQLYKEALDEYSPEVKDQIDSLVQFVTNEFSKRVHPSDNLDYLFSAYFANKILYDLESGSIEAIQYPSVQADLSFENLAIKPEVFDAKYELIEVKDMVCHLDPSNGSRAYMFIGGLDCKSFDYAAGKINWDRSKQHRLDDQDEQFMKDNNVDFSE